jgi:hypothetical protein
MRRGKAGIRVRYHPGREWESGDPRVGETLTKNGLPPNTLSDKAARSRTHECKKR